MLVELDRHQSRPRRLGPRARTRLALALFGIGLLAVLLLWRADALIRSTYLRSLDHHAMLDARLAAIGQLYASLAATAQLETRAAAASSVASSLSSLTDERDLPAILRLPLDLEMRIREYQLRVAKAKATVLSAAERETALELMAALGTQHAQHAEQRNYVMADSRQQIQRVTWLSTITLALAAATLLGAAVLALSELRGRRRSEKVTRDTMASLQRLLEAMPIAVHARDLDGRMILWNKAAERTFGWLRHEVLGTDLQFVAEQPGAGAFTRRHAAQAGAVTEAQFFRAHRRDGTLLDVRSATAPYLNADGKVIGTVAVSDDVSDELLRMAQRRAQDEHQREVLVREVHHRIKNHLQGLAALVHQRLAPTGEPHADADAVVAQLLSLATVHGIKAGGQVEPSLSVAIDAIAAHVSGLTGIACELTVANDDSSVHIADEHAVAVALAINELLTNAVKHRLSGSRAPIAIELRERDAHVDVVIRNRGVLPGGFDLDALRHAGTGMSLISALLPRPGAALAFAQRDGWVIATLSLTRPVIKSRGTREPNASEQFTAHLPDPLVAA